MFSPDVQKSFVDCMAFLVSQGGPPEGHYILPGFSLASPGLPLDDSQTKSCDFFGLHFF